MARLRWIALFALSMALAVPATARACSCLPAPPPGQAAEQADFVFAGTVTETRRIEHSSKDPTQGQIAYSFEVSQAYKGEVQGSLEVLSAASGAMCGRSFAQGQAYLVYARSKNGQAHDNLCSRTRRLADASEDLEFFGNNDDASAAAGVAGAQDTPPREPPRTETPSEAPGETPPPVAGQCRACSCSVPADGDKPIGALLIVIVTLDLRRRASARQT